MSLVESSSYHEVSTDPFLQQATNEKLHTLEKTHTRDYTNLPLGKIHVGCKQINKIG